MWMCVVWHETFTNEARKNESMCCVTWQIHKWGKKEWECLLCDIKILHMRQERIRMCFVCHDPFANEASKNGCECVLCDMTYSLMRQETMLICVVWHDTFTNEARKNKKVFCVTWHIYKRGKMEEKIVLCDMTHSQMRQERMCMCVVWHGPLANESRKKEWLCMLCDMTHSLLKQQRMRKCVVWHNNFAYEARENKKVFCVTWPIYKRGKKE
jgi:hypothetical protein